MRSFWRERHGDFEDLLRQAGLDHVGYEDLDRYIALADYAYLLELAAEAAADDGFALRWAQADRNADLGSLPLCLRYAPDLRAAMDAFVRYVPLNIDLEEIGIAAGAEAVRVSWAYSPLILHQDQLADRCAALFASWLAAAVPPGEPAPKLRLRRKRPAAPLCPTATSLRVQFEAEENAIVFPARCLDLPNPRADTHLYRALCELNDRLLCERRRCDDLVLRVREEILRRLPEGEAALEPIARILGFSCRGLQRRLSAEGTNFNVLVGECRKEAARRYIEETDLMVSEIAYRLGFSSIGSFTRAAKRWFGHSPRVYRNRLQYGRDDGCARTAPRMPASVFSG